jgi:hypothetical protein
MEKIYEQGIVKLLGNYKMPKTKGWKESEGIG